MRPSPSDDGGPARRGRRGLVTGILAVALATLLVLGLRARGPVVPTTRAVRADISRHVVASGRVRVTTRVQLAAQVSGRVLEVAVAEGRTVRAGDLLVRIDDREARAAVAQAEAAVDRARGLLDQLQRVSAVVTGESSRQAAVALEQAEATLARTRTLAASGALSRVDLEDAERAVDIARARKQAADAEAAAATPGGADLGVAEAGLAEARAQAEAARVRLAHTRVTAPEAGTILTRAVEPGDTVQPGATLFELAAGDHTELVIEPDERNLAWIREGQVARASADAFPDRQFDARVDFVAPAVDARRGSIEVRLVVPDPPPGLRPDMTVSVELAVATEHDVVVVPSEALRDVTSGTPFVWVVEGARVARRPVMLGLRGDGHSEIVSGLDAGAEVVLATDRPISDGQRVRTRPEVR